MGIGDWGLGIGDWAQSPIPNPQSPIPNYRNVITIIPVFGKENKNISEIPNTQMENTISIMTNNSITVNTTNISPQCTLRLKIFWNLSLMVMII